MGNIEKLINNFYKRFSECTDCNRTRGLKRYYDKKNKISNRLKTYYEKNRGRILLQKQNNRWLQSSDFVISYVELEKLSINESEINPFFYERNL